MRQALKLYRLINLLNVDVVAGAVVGSLFLAKWFTVKPSLISLVVLGLTVWIIYTLDRLLDVRDGNVASARHQFHKKYERTLWRLLMPIMIINGALIYFMPWVVIKRGLMLSFIVVIYIFFRKRLHLFKEFFVALLYTTGVAIPAVPATRVAAGTYLPLLSLFFLALLNLIIFSCFEIQNDRNDRENSIAIILDKSTVHDLLLMLFFVAWAIPAYMIFSFKTYLISFVLLAMTAVLMLIYFNRSFFEKHDYFRMAGDAVFLLPIVYLLP